MKNHIQFFAGLILILLLAAEAFAQTSADAGNFFTVGSREQTAYSPEGDIDGLNMWALPTNGATSVNSRAPSNGWRYQRTEYLITPAEMSSSGFPSGAVLNSIGFYISSAGSGALSGTLKIYLKNTTDSVYSLGSSWTTAGFTLVSHNEPFNVPVSPAGSIYNIVFTGGSSFTYDGGGIYVAWEFNTPDGTPGTINVVHYCDNKLPNSLYGHRTAAGPPTLLSPSDYRPATRFGTNSYDDMIDITNIYSLERVPVPFGTPPSVGVRLTNVSPLALTFDLILTVKDAATSAVRYTASQTLTYFAGYSTTVVNFPGWSPTLQEDVIITAETSLIPDETWTSNNSRSIPANVNDNLYSYNFNMVDAGGYGYLYPNTGVFASKFIMNGTGIMTGVNVYIYNYPANIGNTVYAVALNGAGVIVAQSDNYIIQPGDLGTLKNFTFTSPPLFHNQIFYAGVAQTAGSVQWYPLGTFTENPQRGNTFYTFPISGGTPQVNNVLAKFGIEALVAPSSAEVIDAGTVSIDIASNQNPGIIVPKATVKNFGTNPKSFNVTFNISDGYVSTRSVTNLSPGASQQITFDNWNATLGQYTIDICTQLSGDINPDNNCLSKPVGVYTGSWTSGTDFPISTYLGSGVGYKTSSTEAVTSYLFSIGGNTTSSLLTECFKYNVNTGVWTAIASLPAPRRILATALVGDYIYAIGGSNLSSIYQSTVYKYSIAGNTWTNAASLPVAVAWGKAAVYKNKIYFAGGMNSSGSVLSSVYVYDPLTNNWSAASSMPAPKFGGAFSVAGNKLIYVGGSDGISITGDVYTGTISDINPLSISWINAGMYPGIAGEVFNNQEVKVSDEIKPGTVDGSLSQVESYPPGSMFRFDAAPWGTNSIIVAGGSPTASWMPNIPSPCYTYNPYSNLWTKQGDLISPVLGSSLGTVNNGNVWKLIVASGLGVSQAENITQIWTDTAAAPAIQVSVNVQDKWNVVSIPGLHPDNQNINTWWSYRDPSASVFRFSGSYQSVTAVEPGKGYWMKHSGARTYNTGDEWPAGGIFAVPHDPIAVNTGWNIIGPYEQSVTTGSLTTTPLGLITGSIYSYNSGYTPVTNLLPGYGYFIKVNGPGFINIPGSTADMNLITPEYKTNEFGRIIITDKLLKSYTLFAANKDVDLAQFELPPLPPQGMFDIRYSTQRYVESLRSGPKIIEMTGVEYPVKIRAEKTGIILSDETGKEIARLRAGEEITLNASGSKLMASEDFMPMKYSLEQNYPNPFNPSTRIKFSVPEEVFVNLTIYSLIGERIKEVKNEKMKAGYHEIELNASDLATGVYFYRLQAGTFTQTRKMILIK